MVDQIIARKEVARTINGEVETVKNLYEVVQYNEEQEEVWDNLIEYVEELAEDEEEPELIGIILDSDEDLLSIDTEPLIEYLEESISDLVNTDEENEADDEIEKLNEFLMLLKAYQGYDLFFQEE